MSVDQFGSDVNMNSCGYFDVTNPFFSLTNACAYRTLRSVLSTREGNRMATSEHTCQMCPPARARVEIIRFCFGVQLVFPSRTRVALLGLHRPVYLP